MFIRWSLIAMPSDRSLETYEDLIWLSVAPLSPPTPCALIAQRSIAHLYAFIGQGDVGSTKSIMLSRPGIHMLWTRKMCVWNTADSLFDIRNARPPPLHLLWKNISVSQRRESLVPPILFSMSERTSGCSPRAPRGKGAGHERESNEVAGGASRDNGLEGGDGKRRRQHLPGKK